MHGTLRRSLVVLGIGLSAFAQAAEFPYRVLDLEAAEAEAKHARQASPALAKAGGSAGLEAVLNAPGLGDHARERLLHDQVIALRAVQPDASLRAAVTRLAARGPKAWVWLDEPGHAPHAIPYAHVGAAAGLTLRVWNRNAIKDLALKQGVAAALAADLTVSPTDRAEALAEAVPELPLAALAAAQSALKAGLDAGDPVEAAIAALAVRRGDAAALQHLFAVGDPGRSVHLVRRAAEFGPDAARTVLAGITRPELLSAARYASAALDRPPAKTARLPQLAPTTCTFAGNEIANPFDAGCGGAQFTYTVTQDDDTHIALGYPVPIPVASETPVAGFRTYATLHARHQNLMTATGAYTSHTVGQTRSGRDIFAYRIGDADTARPNGGTEGAILINGGIHAREWQSPESVTEFLERLASNATDAGVYQFVHENLTTVLLPVLNVDGFLQTQRFPDRVTAHPGQPREGRMRRKNLRHPTTGVVDEDITTAGDNFYGVDLNRNNPVGFGQNGGSSASTTSLVFRGPAAGSEPEITALRAAATLGPEARLRMYSDTHSFTQAYLVSQSTNTRTNAVTVQLVNAMTGVSNGRYVAFFDGINTDIGTTSDYFSETYRVPSWTLELEPINGAVDYGGSSHGHGGFITPDAEIQRLREEVARMYLMGAYRQAGPPSVREVIIADGAGAVVQHQRWAASSATARTLTRLVDQPLVAGTTYTLWVAFDKPMDNATDRIGGGALSVSLRPGSGAASVIGTVAAAGWQTTARPSATAVSGFLRYRNDAAAFTFTMPTLTGTSAGLEFTAADWSRMSLDANPATIADWVGGNWVEYEGSGGADGDIGGTDSSLTVTLNSTGGGGSGGGGGGGGGAPGPLSLLVLGLLAFLHSGALRYAARHGRT